MSNFDPTSVTVVLGTIGSGQATVSWTQPVNGAPPYYTLLYSQPQGLSLQVPGTTTSVLLTNLALGQSYIFYVTTPLGGYSAASASATIPVRVFSAPPASGDQIITSLDTSPFRLGSWSLLSSGTLFTAAGDLVMWYWTHNCGLDANGNFLARDDTGPQAFFTITEGIGVRAPIHQVFSNASAAAGTVPGAWTLQYSLDTTNGAIARAYTDGSGTPGNATINTPTGKAAFAIGASTVVITSSLTTAISHIIVTMEGADATLTSILRAVPSAGSFTVTGNANATAATNFKFSVFN